MTKIYFVRHGSIKSNKLKIYAGWGEEELDEEGIDQARKVGRLLRDRNIDVIYTSPIKRAIQTAEIIATHFYGLKIIIEKGLKEMKLGPWEGLSENEIAIKYPEEFKLWNSKPVKLKLPGRETLSTVQNRAVKAVRKILSNQNRDAIAVTHVVIIRCLFLYYNNLNLNSYKKIEVPNASVFTLQLDHGFYHLRRLLQKSRFRC